MKSHYCIVFPGQGSQSLGMLAELAERYRIVDDTYAEASEVLGYDLWALTQQGPIEQLNQTIYTQPALLTAGVAVWRVWQQANLPSPDYLAGHSLGEYTALVAAQSLEFTKAVYLVQQRATFMQHAVPEGRGSMAAIIGLDNKTIEALCVEINTPEQTVQPANYNAIGQVVVAGHMPAVEALMQASKKAGAKLTKQLPMSVPSHCQLMESAAQHMAQILKETPIVSPQIPVIHNVDVCSHTDVVQLRQTLVKQLDSPVRWVETIQLFATNGIKLLIECGPGQVLAGLTRRIDKTIETYTTNDLISLTNAQNAVNNFIHTTTT